MKCEYCEIVAGKKKAEIVYQDDDIVAFVQEDAITPGQIIVIPKEHLTILEMLPVKTLQKLTSIANKLGMALFDSLGCQGTNILVENGLGAGQKVPHFSMHIVPRNENDGLNLQWQPQQVPEDELQEAFIQIQSNSEGLVVTDKEEPKEVVVESEKTEAVLEDDGENYLLKSIRRKP